VRLDEETEKMRMEVDALNYAIEEVLSMECEDKR